MMYGHRIDCCGVVELHGLQAYARRPKAITLLREAWIQAERHEWKFAFFLFTDHRSTVRGELLAEAIEKHGLGKLHATRVKKNLNTGNNIKMWVWDVNKRTFKAFAKKQGWYAEWAKQQKVTRPENVWYWSAPELVQRIEHDSA